MLRVPLQWVREPQAAAAGSGGGGSRGWLTGSPDARHIILALRLLLASLPLRCWAPGERGARRGAVAGRTAARGAPTSLHVAAELRADAMGANMSGSRTVGEVRALLDGLLMRMTPCAVCRC